MQKDKIPRYFEWMEEMARRNDSDASVSHKRLAAILSCGDNMLVARGFNPVSAARPKLASHGDAIADAVEQQNIIVKFFLDVPITGHHRCASGVFGDVVQSVFSDEFWHF
jgi:hypothetical protein